jgi:hypothetical protein
VDQDRLGGFGLGLLAGSFDEFAVDEGRSVADQGDEVGCVDGAPAVSWADSMSLNAIASPAARDPGPLVTLVRCLTVAKVDSIVILSS